MTKNDFLVRFNLLQLTESEHTYKHLLPLKSAAVLIGLIESGSESQMQILLTKRASHLRHHPSQVSFPGGKVESTDKSIIDTALRETFEEIGVPQQAITVIGQLPPYQTMSGFNVTPVVAIIDADQDYQLDNNEVVEIFHVPLQYFLTSNQDHMLVTSKSGIAHKVHFLPYQHYNIWGATAVMIKDLITLLS
jgi:8-oxo-dGTP pyrophosphatase MutT (NUDIX family)